MTSIAGKLLVASPHLMDRNFFRTVVYILRHEPTDAFGLVLNRPTEYTLAEALEEALGERLERVDALYWGGPVSGPLTALHLDRRFDQFDSQSGVYATTEQDHLLELIRGTSAPIKFFGGYSGWGAGQLDGELKEGGWLLTDASPDDLFSSDAGLWEAALRRVGKQILGGILPDDESFDPTVN